MKHLDILIVDDDSGDVTILQDSFEDAPFSHHMEVAVDGVSALRRLKEGDLPDLVLLDLNMPGLDGHQTLQRIRNDERTADLPVIVLTTSEREDDIEESFTERANYFVTKPHDLEGFEQLIRLVEDFARAYIWKEH